MKVYKDGVEVVSLWQYDKNISLQFSGLDTTLQTQIQYGHGNDKTPAVTPTVVTVGCEQRFEAAVPNKILEDGWDVFVYAYQSRGDSGWTETMVKIPVNERMPSREWIPSDDPGYIDLQDMRDDIDTLQAEMPLKEDVANKVTALNADVTDTQYPSAKATYDMIELVSEALVDFGHTVAEEYLSKDPGAVGTANLADSAVTSAKLNNGAVASEKLGTSAVTNTKIADGAVTSAKIADNAVGSAKIPSGAIAEGHLANGAVTTAKIADSAVTADKIANGAVNGAKIADFSVVAQHIYPGAVTTAKIDDSAVTNAKLADGAVRGNNLADDSVYAQHIHTGAVETAKIADLAVTTGKIADGAVNGSKLAYGAVSVVHIADNAVVTNAIVDGQVTAAKLATAVSNVLNGAEQTTNKVTSVSSASTDTQYPSAKCVFDYGQSIQTAIEGDLEMARAALGYVTPANQAIIDEISNAVGGTFTPSDNTAYTQNDLDEVSELIGGND